jgi:AAA family ATPase
VDRKYVLSNQVIQIQYESKKRFFSVATVSTRIRNAGDPDAKISERLGSLSMDDDTIHIHIVDWDTTVAIEDNVQVPEPKQQTVKKFLIPSCFVPSDPMKQFDVGVSEQPRGTDAYAAVGGLDEQIAQIRDLIEIPLRRPELFRHFRECQRWLAKAAQPPLTAS